jgi:hypothetical protein
MNFGETIALAGLKSSKYASMAAYTAAKTATSVPAPFVLQFFCILYQKILNDASRAAIDDLFKNPSSPLNSLQTKYEMVTVMCQNETIDPMSFIHEHQSMVESMLIQIGLDPQIIQSIDVLKETINKNIRIILDYIQTKTEVLKQMKLTGGRRKRRKTKKNRYVRKRV